LYTTELCRCEPCYNVIDMRSLVQEKEMAITLRKQGHTYKEILAVVPVAKSSLSLWLKDLPLTKAEKNLLKHRTDSNISRGRIKAATAIRLNHFARNQQLLINAKEDFEKYYNETLFHTGIALYWAEGAKRSEMFLFTNSDEVMIKVMLMWMEKYTKYNRHELGYRLYIHHPFMHENWEAWWQKYLGVDKGTFKKTILKPTNLGIKKRPNYKGCLRVEVPKSSELLMKMKFWMNLQVEYHLKQ